MTAVFAGVVDASDDQLERMADVLTDITDEDLYWYSAGDTALVSTNTGIDQGNCAVLFNGYLFDVPAEPEAFIADLYAEHGPDFITQLDGNFRVAVYDAAAERLVLATDRVNDDFVFYTDAVAGFAFSSHLTALTAHPGYTPGVNEARMVDALIGLNPTNSGGATLLNRINKMHSSQRLIYDGNGTRTDTYWDYYHRTPIQVSDRVAATRLDALVHQAAERLHRIDDDVPLLLSGGLDSNYLLAVLDDVIDQQLETVTFGWEDAHFEDAHTSVDLFNTAHQDIRLPMDLPGQRDLWMQEQPSGISIYFDYQAVREQTGIDRWYDGGRSEFIYQVDLHNFERLNHIRWLKPVVNAMETVNMGSVLNRFHPKAGHAIDILISPYHSAVATNAWGLRRKTKERIIADRYRDMGVPLEQRIDAEWGLDIPDYEWNYQYLRMRTYEFQDFSLFTRNMQRFDVFSYGPLIDYATRLPVAQQRGRRLLKMVAADRVPDHAVDNGAAAGPLHMNVLRQVLQRNWDDHVAAMDRFMERGFVDPVRAEPVLCPDRPDRLTATQGFYLSNMYMLEQWLETFIDRSSPWIRPA